MHFVKKRYNIFLIWRDKKLKYNTFRRWLLSQKVNVINTAGSHKKIKLKNKQSIFPDHGSKEIPEPLRKKILKDLNL